jgi:hypothetical protein
MFGAASPVGPSLVTPGKLSDVWPFLNLMIATTAPAPTAIMNKESSSGPATDFFRPDFLPDERRRVETVGVSTSDRTALGGAVTGGLRAASRAATCSPRALS